MIKNTRAANIETENNAGLRRPAVMDIFIFALIALAAFGLNAIL